jgi:hypothetical protein
MTLLADVRYACRTLRKAPLFTTLTVLSVGLGIGANAIIFSLLDQIVLRPLPSNVPTSSCSSRSTVNSTATPGATGPKSRSRCTAIFAITIGCSAASLLSSTGPFT